MSTLDPEHWFDEIWRRVREQMRVAMDERHFEYWVAPLQIVSADAERVVIACSTGFGRDRTVEKLGQRIADLIARHVPNLVRVDFIVDPAPKAPPPPTRPRGMRATGLAVCPVAVARPQMPSSPTVETPAPVDDDDAIAKASERRIYIEDIKRKVAEKYAVSVGDLESPSRKREHVRPRQLAMHISRKLTGRSFPEIAKRFGSRDHSTVIHGCRKIQLQSANDPIMAAEVEELLRMFEN